MTRRRPRDGNATQSGFRPPRPERRGESVPPPKATTRRGRVGPLQRLDHYSAQVAVAGGGGEA